MTLRAPGSNPPPPGVLSSLATVVGFLGRRPGAAALTLGLLLANITIELTLPQILGETLNALRRLEPGAPVRALLARSAGGYFALAALRTVIGLFLGPLRNRTAQRTLGDIRAAVFQALQRRSFAWHDNAAAGELISRAGTDIWRLQDFMFVCLLFSVDVAAGMAGTVVLVFAVRASLGWIALGALVPAAAVMAFYAVRIQPRWRRVHDRHSAMSTVIQENIAGARVVRAFAREDGELARFAARKRSYLEELLATVNYWAVRAPAAQFFFGLSAPAALWAGGRQVIAGKLPLGDLAKVVFYLLGMGGRIGMIGQVTTIVQNAGSSAQRIREILDAPAAPSGGRIRFAPGAEATPASIRFRNVSFSYPKTASLAVEGLASKGVSLAQTKADPGPARPAVGDVSFFVAPGETVALAGPTGAGKSTLLALIPRFYDPDAGSVEVDGIDVRDLAADGLRSAVATVFQESFLFSATIAENIALGRPEASRAEIELAARAARADGFIRELPLGYETVVGERGVSLSGGQRQRISIARALLMNPRILLLDDATSAIDPGTEREIQEAVAEVRRGRTTVLVAQRLSTLWRADRVLVLEGGRIVDEGRPGELARRPGPFQRLFASQLAGAAPPVPIRAGESAAIRAGGQG